MRRAIRTEEQCEKSINLRSNLCLNDTDGGGSKRNRFGRGSGQLVTNSAQASTAILLESKHGALQPQKP